MTVEKISISLDQEIAARARRAAELEGMSLSGWLAKAADEAASLVEARAAMAEYIKIYGEPDEDATRWAEEQLDAAGVGQPVPLDQTEQNRAALASLLGLPLDTASRRAG
jgi:hypothetical protein